MLGEINHDSTTNNTTCIATLLVLNHKNVWQVLKNEKLHPYNLTPVQNLLVNDKPQRKEFCQWILQLSDNDLTKILTTHEAQFTRDGEINSPTSFQCQYLKEGGGGYNPNCCKTCNFPKFNIWPTLYRFYFKRIVWFIWRHTIALANLQGMIFQQDGAVYLLGISDEQIGINLGITLATVHHTTNPLNQRIHLRKG